MKKISNFFKFRKFRKKNKLQKKENAIFIYANNNNGSGALQLVEKCVAKNLSREENFGKKVFGKNKICTTKFYQKNFIKKLRKKFTEKIL